MSKDKHRKPCEIAYTILKLVREGDMDWTHIYYRSGTSTAVLNRYVNRLLRDQLMIVSQREDGKRIYHLTSKGNDFIEAYVRMLIATDNLSDANKEMEVFKTDLLSAKESLLR